MVAFSRLVDDKDRWRAIWKMIASLGTVEMVGVPVFYYLGTINAQVTSKVLLLGTYGGVNASP